MRSPLLRKLYPFDHTKNEILVSQSGDRSLVLWLHDFWQNRKPEEMRKKSKSRSNVPTSAGREGGEGKPDFPTRKRLDSNKFQIYFLSAVEWLMIRPLNLLITCTKTWPGDWFPPQFSRFPFFYKEISCARIFHHPIFSFDNSGLSKKKGMLLGEKLSIFLWSPNNGTEILDILT